MRPSFPKTYAGRVIASASIGTLVLTILTTLMHGTRLLCALGLIWTFVLFGIFALVSRLEEWFLDLSESLGDLPFRTILTSFFHLCSQYSILIRGAALALSMWIVDGYLALAQGGIHKLAEEFPRTLMGTLCDTTLVLTDTLRGKSVDQPGWPTKFLSIGGGFLFFKNGWLLLNGLEGADALSRASAVYSNPFWIFDSEARFQAFKLVFDHGLASALMLAGVPLFVIYLFKEVLGAPYEEKTSMFKALAYFNMWLLSAPLYALVSMILSL
jgi:hypothetical protein